MVRCTSPRVVTCKNSSPWTFSKIQSASFVLQVCGALGIFFLEDAWFASALSWMVSCLVVRFVTGKLRGNTCLLRSMEHPFWGACIFWDSKLRWGSLPWRTCFQQIVCANCYRDRWYVSVQCAHQSTLRVKACLSYRQEGNMNGPLKWSRPKRLVTDRQPRLKNCLTDEEDSRVKAITFIQCPEVDSKSMCSCTGLLCQWLEKL